MVGHSGEETSIPLVEAGLAPPTRKERLQVVRKIMAHSQYCMSGDTTVEATQQAMREVIMQDGDEHYVFVISDANLRRYGISPQTLAESLMNDARVNAYIMFIASIQDEAERLCKGITPGHAYTCTNTADMPATFKQIFTSAGNLTRM